MGTMLTLCGMLAAAIGCGAAGHDPALAAPAVDYHQHLVSPAFAPIVKYPERDGRALVAQLDAAGIERAVVLSMGYSLADERKASSTNSA